jgi:hypothetical protein
MSIARDLARRILPERIRRWLLRIYNDFGFVPSLSPEAPAAGQPSPFSAWVAVPNELTELGDKHCPTKRYHNYLVYYWLHLRDVREQVRTVIEIGLETDRSVKMWREFFPNATIYGIDINPKCKEFESDRIKVFVGAQQDTKFLAACLETIGAAPDVVIDDGSHLVHHQVATFNYLFPRLSDHGIYVVEDTGGCVEDNRLRTVNRLKTLIDCIFYWPKGPTAQWSTLSQFPESASWLSRNVTGVAFYRWIVFIMRGHNPQDNPYLPLKE